jgi:hypothetical protein
MEGLLAEAREEESRLAEVKAYGKSRLQISWFSQERYVDLIPLAEYND